MSEGSDRSKLIYFATAALSDPAKMRSLQLLTLNSEFSQVEKGSTLELAVLLLSKSILRYGTDIPTLLARHQDHADEHTLIRAALKWIYGNAQRDKLR